MLLIPCPFCGPRNETEFAHGGCVKSRRPDNPGDIAETEWIEYLTVPDNPCGPVHERWWHVRGCGLWFTLVRDTRSHDLVNGDSA